MFELKVNLCPDKKQVLMYFTLIGYQWGYVMQNNNNRINDKATDLIVRSKEE